MVAVVSPVIEIVGRINVLDVGVELVGSAEGAALTGVQVESLAVTRGLAGAFAHADDGVTPVRAGLHAIVTGLKDRKCLVGSIDFEVIAVVHPAHGDVESAGAELNLNRIVVEIQEREASIGAQRD